jgi:hypothetical protein
MVEIALFLDSVKVYADLLIKSFFFCLKEKMGQQISQYMHFQNYFPLLCSQKFHHVKKNKIWPDYTGAID